MLTQRQEKLLDFLVREYISTAEPVGSLSLKKVCDLDVSGATIRNDLQALTEEGYITQPHTSAGRIPTKKAYKYFVEKIEQKRAEEEITSFIVRQARFMNQEMEHQMREMEELMQKLDDDNLFEKLITIEIWHKKNQN